MDPATAFAIAAGASKLAGLFKTDPFKKTRQLAQNQLVRRTLPQLEGGIPNQNILGLSKVISRGVQPLVKSVFGRAAARFGSRSGIAAGAAVSAGTSAIGAKLAELFGQKIFSDRADLRHSASVLTSLATKEGK